MTNKIIHPSGWKQAKGYANGILTDDGTLYIGGQIGWNSDQVFESTNFVGQMEQALRNILEIVTTAGGTAENIVRLTWYITDKKDYLKNQKEIGKVYRRILGRNFPAMAMVVVSSLIEDKALLEIEATVKLQ
tara:strand:- start:469 stop:864 length:396 start_codon:yes stop_codon:yes gene_type:complete